MRRFAVSYLTVSFVIIVLANLTLAVLFVRQFSLKASTINDCLPNDCQQVSSFGDFVVANLVLVGLLLIIWFVATKIRHRYQADS